MSPTVLGPLRRVILQSTSFCNIDCAYCYLPDRDRRGVMSDEVVAATAAQLADCSFLADDLEVRWHAGEPLTAPPHRYREWCRILVEALAGRCRLRFSVQTNALLINDAWCDLFEEFDVRVGVSLDGPAIIHDAFRRTRQGSGSFERAMRGVAVLRRRGIPFEVISVVTELTLRHREAYQEFLRELGPLNVGLNPEESEGEHTSELFARVGFQADYREFLASMLEFERATAIPVRRLSSMRAQIRSGSLPLRNDQVEPLRLLSVAVDGRLSTCSPELLGVPSADYGDFVLGHVLDPELRLDRWPETFERFIGDVAAGRDLCAASCGYFALCGGGAAVNKLVENGTVVSTQTSACVCNIQAVVDVVLDELERDRAATG